MKKGRFLILASLVFLLSLVLVLDASAALWTRNGGTTMTGGTGTNTGNWSGNIANGAVRARSESKQGFLVPGLGYAKSQSVVCQNITPTFTGTGKFTVTVVLNGELKATSQGFKALGVQIMGGAPSADVRLLLQFDKTKVVNQGLMYVQDNPGLDLLPSSYQYNNAQRSFTSSYPVTKGRTIEVCGGIMTNTGNFLGGGHAISDFYSSRFAPTYVKSITISR